VGLAAQLPHRLDHLGDAAAVGRVVVAQATAVGVEGQRPTPEIRLPSATKRPPSPLAQKPRSSSCISTVMVKLS
jgi:hypothetical protein